MTSQKSLADKTLENFDLQRLLSSVALLTPSLQTATSGIEQSRRLPQAVADALAAQGLYSMLLPQHLGGSESSARTFVLVIEQIAQAEASAAWCAFISNTSALIAGYLHPEIAKQVFGRPNIKLAGVFAPKGRAKHATRDGEKGYLVSGTWQWGSGAFNAEYITAGCLVVDEEGKLETLEDGSPNVRTVLLKASQIALHDSWTAMGLRGTNSGEFSASEVFVPQSMSASILTDTPLQLPLYKFPIFCLLALGIAAVALGIARLSIDSFATIARKKMPQGGRRLLAERTSVQLHVAKAEAQLRSARAFLLDCVDNAWISAERGELAIEHKRDLRLATTHATDVAATVVTAMYGCGGGDAIFDCSPLQKCLRDIHVAKQHLMVSESTYEQVGRIFLDLPTNVAML